MNRYAIGLGLAACLSVQSFAGEVPVAGRNDARMRSVIYDPSQVVRLSTAMGAVLVVSFSSDETITAVAVTDSKDLVASPRDNYLFLKSRQILPPQPVVVLTSGPKGLRRYVFEIVTTAAATLTADNHNIFYSVQFVYPGDEAAARAKADKKRREQQKTLLAEAMLARAHNMMETPSGSPGGAETTSVPRGVNWRYVGRGSRTLQPLEVYDNGFSTVFRFPGNMRMPSIFKLNPDGKEATVNYSVRGDSMIVSSVAPAWRLRDGKTVLCIWNRAYDNIGNPPTTGTTSVKVQRVIKGVER